jgi:unsaturated chondroitin disaccharide hydrolase
MLSQKEQGWIDAATEKLTRVAARVEDNIPYQSYEGAWRFTNRTEAGEEPLWSRGTELVHTEALDWWTNGFWGGLLWLLYDQTGDARYRQYAIGLEERLDSVIEGFDLLSHDMGFMWMLTSGAHYRRFRSPEALLRLKKTASHLAGRFNPAGDFLRAWKRKGLEGWAIIDCMMNLPLLYYVSELEKDPRFANVARAHADMALREFQRPDGSVYHIVTFDPVTGKRTGQQTGQGYSETSSWSRGTGWAIYGFALSAKYTGEKKYLNAAVRSARFFMDHLPADGVPRADLLAPLDDPECDIDSSTLPLRRRVCCCWLSFRGMKAGAGKRCGCSTRCKAPAWQARRRKRCCCTATWRITGRSRRIFR